MLAKGAQDALGNSLVREQWHEDGYWAITSYTGRGAVDMRLHPAPLARAAVVLAGSSGGGFDSPARDLYGRLAGELPLLGISVLRVGYRVPSELDEAAHDLLCGLVLLQERGVRRMGLVGHAFGGAVVITAASRARTVATVVAMASHRGGRGVEALAGRSLLLIHGEDDTVLPPSWSRSLYDAAALPKRLHVLPGAGHNLDEAHHEVFELVQSWLASELLETPARRSAPLQAP